MDKYLNPTETYKRLLSEYNKYGSLVVAVDFDGTLYDFHNEGITFYNVIDLLRELKKANCYIIIFTANDNTEFIENYLLENQIPYDGINENPSFFKGKSSKIYYNILLDDRAGLKEVYTQLLTLLTDIKHEF